MSEQRTRVRVIQVEMTCDRCMLNVMRPLNYVLTVSPPLFPHQCIGCGHKANYRKTYPAVEYENAEGE